MQTVAPTPEDYQHIKEKIVDYLSGQGFSEKKLMRKVTDLKRRYPHTARYRFYTAEHVQIVLDELKSLGLVDDRKFAETLLHQLRDRKDGLHRIRQKMHQRLIPGAIINEVLGGWQETGAEQDYTAIIRATKAKYERLKEKYPSPKDRYTVKSKLYAFLGQKGYSSEEITKIINVVVVDKHDA